ncbi:uncharacterized protein LOC130991974 isoform X2 [Salvia miltiorrhiza]|uniref:uncharacterized protein LOC130991974 isoform X2 n=1 Tax=Salvia miltiorrhiza TaxID=226208 RepID=UPI0025AD499D|nr:uncharacterized protein LOC130991974 isoform X2 [Salvia miltiorrhiza]
MAFDCNSNHRKPLLFSDLFKNHRNSAPLEKEQHDAAIISASSSSPSSSSTQFLSSWDSSSSSGFSTPLRSDFGSSEGDDADFIAELTRQMAECMLDDDEHSAADNVYEVSGYENSGAVSSLKTESYSSSVSADDPTQPSIQVYELKNQPPVTKERSTRGRRVRRRSESAQPQQLQKTEQQYKQYRGIEWGGVGINGYSGSGMQAVFLGGSGTRIGSNGTGVFLPRDPTELKNKSANNLDLESFSWWDLSPLGKAESN